MEDIPIYQCDLAKFLAWHNKILQSANPVNPKNEKLISTLKGTGKKVEEIYTSIITTQQKIKSITTDVDKERIRREVEDSLGKLSRAMDQYTAIARVASPTHGLL